MNEKALEQRLREVSVPSHITNGLARYVVYGTPTGGFLKAVLEDKLTQAFARADDTNLAAMHAIVGAIYNEVPHGCHGSPEKVKAWIDRGGLGGVKN